MALDRSLLARAAALRGLDDEVRRSARTAEHAALAERYATEHQELVGPYHAALERLRVRDASDLDLVLTYLETRPDFLGAGYLAARIIRALAKLDPSVLDRPRVDAALARIEAEPRSEEQRAAASLVTRLAAGSPRRAPRVLEKKERPARPTRKRDDRPDDDEPHAITVKGRAI
jgi:hypothetical protein